MRKGKTIPLREKVANWTCNQFAITNRHGDAALLRKLADSIEELGPVDILAITYSRDSGPTEPDITVRMYFALLDDEEMAGGRPGWFIGDLDPQDLAIYLGLVAGGDDMKPGAGGWGDLGYAGIDDDWMELAERHFVLAPWSSESFENAVTIEMSGAEREYWNALTMLVPNLSALVGERAFSILTRGAKIEIDALLNPRLFSEQYPKAVLEAIFRE
jgi:hypothetical protein